LGIMLIYSKGHGLIMSDLTLAHTLNDAGQLTITIGGRLAIDTTAALKDFLLEQWPASKSIRLDSSALEEIDLTGMQLLCSACYTALSENRSFRFSGKPAPCIAQGVDNLGFQDHKLCKHNASISCIWSGGIN